MLYGCMQLCNSILFCSFFLCTLLFRLCVDCLNCECVFYLASSILFFFIYKLYICFLCLCSPRFFLWEYTSVYFGSMGIFFLAFGWLSFPSAFRSFTSPSVDVLACCSPLVFYDMSRLGSICLLFALSLCSWLLFCSLLGIFCFI